MNSRARSICGRGAGFSLIECVVYLSVVTVVLGIASATCWRCWDAQRAMRRDAEDIVRALRAGEQWRADIRAATGPIRRRDDGEVRRLLIPTAGGLIDYHWTQAGLRRQAGGGGVRDVLLLARVRSCRMQAEDRGRVQAWRWELELQPARPQPRFRPWFTFEAVPGFGSVR